MKTEVFSKSPHLSLLANLVKVFDFEDFDLIISTVWDSEEEFDFTIYPAIITNLRRVLDFILEPMRAKIPPNWRKKKQQASSPRDFEMEEEAKSAIENEKGPVVVKNRDQICTEVTKVLSILSTLIGNNQETFLNLLRVIGYHLVQEDSVANHPQLLELISEHLLPAIALTTKDESHYEQTQKTNLVGQIESEMWFIFKEYPF